MLEIDGLHRHDVDAHGTRIHVAEVGEGPLVLFVHGFPESWYSWRHQLVALAADGYRAAAIDVRGYGSSEAPPDVDDYRIVALAGDCVGDHAFLGGSGGLRSGTVFILSNVIATFIIALTASNTSTARSRCAWDINAQRFDNQSLRL